jgi:hypothetical protein
MKDGVLVSVTSVTVSLEPGLFEGYEIKEIPVGGIYAVNAADLTINYHCEWPENRIRLGARPEKVDDSLLETGEGIGEEAREFLGTLLSVIFYLTFQVNI